MSFDAASGSMESWGATLVTGHCPCGVPITVRLKSGHQILDIFYAQEAKGSFQVAKRCKTCSRRVTIEFCQGKTSASEELRHPIERIIRILAGGHRWLILPACLLLAFLLHGVPRIAAALSTPGAIPFLLLKDPLFGLGGVIADGLIMYIWLVWLDRMRRWVGATEDNIPVEYKYHTSRSFAISTSPVYFSLVTILGLIILVAVRMAEWIASELGRIDLLVDIPVAALVVALPAQAFLSHILFLEAMHLPRYTLHVKNPEKDYEVFIYEMRQVFKATYAFIASFVVVGMGSGLLSVFGTWLGHPASSPFIAFAFPIAVAIFSFPTLLLVNASAEARIREWHSSQAQADRYMVLEVITVGDETRVTVETSQPRGRRTTRIVNLGAQHPLLVDRFSNIMSGMNQLAILDSEALRESANLRGATERLKRDMDSFGQDLCEKYIHGPVREGWIGALHEEKRLTVTVMADGRDAALPWELLFYNEDFLCNRVRIARAKRTLDVGHAAMLSIERVLVVASDKPDFPGVPPLPSVATEAETIGKTLERVGLGVQLLSGKNCTKANVLKHLKSGEYQAVHYCGHSVFEAEDPKYSHLLLADEKLTAQELAQVLRENIDLQLVFLGSCWSGTSNYVSTETLQGVADAFIDAGVPYVCGMRSAVSDAGMAILSAEFYKLLALGTSPEEALRRARVATIEEFSWRDPVWAAPILFKA